MALARQGLQSRGPLARRATAGATRPRARATPRLRAAKRDGEQQQQQQQQQQGAPPPEAPLAGDNRAVRKKELGARMRTASAAGGRPASGGVCAARRATPPRAAARSGVGLKATWFAAEALGDLMARGKKQQPEEQQPAAPASSLPAGGGAAAPGAGDAALAGVLEAIRADYAADYFISGKGDMTAYDPDCLFADPFVSRRRAPARFSRGRARPRRAACARRTDARAPRRAACAQVSFRGTERFKKNVSNLGALISDVDLQITRWEVAGNTLEAHWRFSAILALPWRPRLAAAGSTTHVIDGARGVVVEHIERWASEPGEVVARLLKPAARVPTNNWESFMANLAAGDVKGCWYVVNRKAALFAAPVVTAAAAVHAATGHGLPPLLGGSVVEVLAVALLVAGLGTEGVKYVEGTGGQI
ncbi:hypothetical protein HT031_004684 [Scenedesmus sp. PABB004]|nr:hypothetical protein HT031_004684 [Scenedesmus sp. PABB004]